MKLSAQQLHDVRALMLELKGAGQIMCADALRVLLECYEERLKSDAFWAAEADRLQRGDR